MEDKSLEEPTKESWKQVCDLVFGGQNNSIWEQYISLWVVKTILKNNGSLLADYQTTAKALAKRCQDVEDAVQNIYDNDKDVGQARTEEQLAANKYQTVKDGKQPETDPKLTLKNAWTQLVRARSKLAKAKKQARRQHSNALNPSSLLELYIQVLQFFQKINLFDPDAEIAIYTKNGTTRSSYRIMSLQFDGKSPPPTAHWKETMTSIEADFSHVQAAIVRNDEIMNENITEALNNLKVAQEKVLDAQKEVTVFEYDFEQFKNLVLGVFPIKLQHGKGRSSKSQTVINMGHISEAFEIHYQQLLFSIKNSQGQQGDTEKEAHKNEVVNLGTQRPEIAALHYIPKSIKSNWAKNAQAVAIGEIFKELWNSIMRPALGNVPGILMPDQKNIQVKYHGASFISSLSVFSSMKRILDIISGADKEHKKEFQDSLKAELTEQLKTSRSTELNLSKVTCTDFADALQDGVMSSVASALGMSSVSELNTTVVINSQILTVP